MKNHYEIAKEEFALYESQSSLQNMIAVLIGPKADPSITGQLSSLGISKLSSMSINELKTFEGIGEASARRIMAAFGISELISKYKREKNYFIKSPDDVAEYFRDLKMKQQEHFEVLFLTAKNQVIARREIFRGTLNSSLVHPREIFKESIRESAAAIICVHNHPSGDPTPSTEDIEVTERLVEVGKIVGIDVLDHVIVTSEKYVSLKEMKFI